MEEKLTEVGNLEASECTKAALFACSNVQTVLFFNVAFTMPSIVDIYSNQDTAAEGLSP